MNQNNQNNQRVNIYELVNLIELTLPELPRNDYHRAIVKFEEFKETVRKQRKILAKKYHPDKGGSIEHMQKINNAIDILLKINIEPVRPVRQEVVIVVRGSGSGTSTTTFTNSSFSSNWFHR